MLLDNRNNGHVLDELKKHPFENSNLVVLSSLFTIYGFESLRKELSKLSDTRLLLSDWQGKGLQTLIGTESEVRLTNQLNQRYVARECAKWLRGKVTVKANLQSNHSNQNLFHLAAISGEEQFAVHGSATLTPTGLGIVRSEPLQMNTGISDSETTNQLLAWFDGLWSDNTATKEISKELLDRLDFIAEDQSANFVYFLTIYNIFKDFIEDIDEENIIKSKTGFKDTVVWNKL